MNVRETLASLGEQKEELVRQALECTTEEDLVNLAEANNIQLTDEEAGQLFQLMQTEFGELPGSELDGVTGGFSKTEEIVGLDTRCPSCGSDKWAVMIGSQDFFCLKCRRTYVARKKK